MALDFFTFSRPTTTNVIDANGDTVVVAIDTPAFEFNPDGSYRGLKWTDDSEATNTDASDDLGQTEGRIIFEIESVGGELVIDEVSATLDQGISRIEFVYTQTTQTLFVNDVEVDSETGSYDWSSMDKIEIGHDSGSDQPTGVYYRLLAIYKTAN